MALNAGQRKDSNHVIGVDAGGSKTLAVLVDGDGMVAGRASAGGSNVRSVGVAVAEQNLQQVLRELLAGAGVTAVCIGAAGAGREADREQLRELVRRHIPSTVTLDIRTDAEIALAASTVRRPALMVIAGTGSLVYGESDGHAVRAGGYGALIGDPGSGYAIGLAALRHTVAALDAQSQATSPLARAVMTALDTASVQHIIERVAHWPPDIRLIASLAQVVGQMQERDPAARLIAQSAADELGGLVGLVARQVRTAKPLPVALTGGAFKAVPALALAVRRAAEQTGPCELIHPVREPAYGAAMLARSPSHPNPSNAR